MFLKLEHLYQKRNFLILQSPNYNCFSFFSKNEYEEGKNICLDTKATPSGSMGEVSVESSDSNQSARSTASFAFPVYVSA